MNDLLNTQPWMEDGACTRLDPHEADRLFHPHEGHNHPRAARVMCASCPVQLQCAEHAIADPDLTGMWGGLSARERTRIRALRAYRAA